MAYCKDQIELSIVIFKNGDTYLQMSQNLNIEEKFIVFMCRDKVLPVYTAPHTFEENGIQVLRAFLTTYPVNQKKKQQLPVCSIILPKKGILLKVNSRYFDESFESFELPESINYPKVRRLENDPEAKHKFIDDDLIFDDEYENYLDELNVRDDWYLDMKLRNQNLNSISETQKIFLTLTVSPSRLLMLHYVLSTLSLNLVTSIFVVIPRMYKGKQMYRIPRKLKNDFPKIVYLSEEWDHGPISKIASSVQFVYENYEKEVADQSIFISIDDDQRYSERMIDTLVKFSLENPAAVFTVSICNYLATGTFGLPAINHDSVDSINFTEKLISEVEGFAGVVYRGKHVDYKLMKYFTDHRQASRMFPCHLSDDVIIARVLLLRGVNIYKIDQSYSKLFYTRQECRDFPNYRDENALQFTNSEGKTGQGPSHYEKYMKCHVTLISYLIDKNGLNMGQKSVPNY